VAAAAERSAAAPRLPRKVFSSLFLAGEIMARIVGWVLVLSFAAALIAGCSGKKDVIVTKPDDKPLGPPVPLGGGDEKKGGHVQ
jgi:hypothetical protein